MHTLVGEHMCFPHSGLFSHRYVLLHVSSRLDCKKPMRGYARHVGFAMRIDKMQEAGVSTKYTLVDKTGAKETFLFAEVNQMRVLSV